MADGADLLSRRTWPGVTPTEKPYPPPLFIHHFVRNPLRCLPRAVYEEPIVAYEAGPRRVVWVTGPELTETVFLGRHEAFPKPPLEQRVFAAPLGQSILTSQGEDWRWQRQAVADLFRHADILSYAPAMGAAAQALVERWRAGGAAVRRVDKDVTAATYQAISHTLFGGAATPEAADIQAGVEGYLNNSQWEIVTALMGAPSGAWHPGRSRLRRASAQMRGAITRLLDRWEASGAAHGDHLLGRLLGADAPGPDGRISRERVLNNLLTFLNAGHETTAKALIWTLYVLSREQHWQALAREEAHNVIGDGPVAAEHIERLTLIRQVFEEAMRLYAPAPVLTRLATEDIALGDMDVRKGTLIFIPIWAVHRHKRLWADPDRFVPERFAPEARGAIRRTQYMPFGFGPRICIGATFARVEGVAMLAALLRGAEIEWAGGGAPEPLARITLWPRGGMSLRVRPLG